MFRDLETEILKTHPLAEIIDRNFGKAGTKKRDECKNEFRIDVLGKIIKAVKKA